ncbi:hypothetical protein ACS0TY_031996 [Phlomoides rotata]
MDSKNDSEKWSEHYSSKQKILVVGDGDLSFSVSLARSFRIASNMIATSPDTQEQLEMKYPSGATNVAVLKNKGCTVIYGVDASTMRNHHHLSHIKFDVIVFNFPHAGFFTSGRSLSQILVEQDVVRGLLRNADEMLAVGGEVHITHNTPHSFSKCEIEELEKKLLTDKPNFCI